MSMIFNGFSIFFCEQGRESGKGNGLLYKIELMFFVCLNVKVFFYIVFGWFVEKVVFSFFFLVLHLNYMQGKYF